MARDNMKIEFSNKTCMWYHSPRHTFGINHLCMNFGSAKYKYYYCAKSWLRSWQMCILVLWENLLKWMTFEWMDNYIVVKKYEDDDDDKLIIIRLKLIKMILLD